MQVGTAFAFCEESGLREDYKRALLEKIKRGESSVFTDPLSSPTGFPFKAAQLEGTTSETDIYHNRTRICDIGILREAYRSPSGSIAYRCPSEPENVYIAKGGVFEETVGRKCLCNCLLADIGLQQVQRNGDVEPGLVTTGDDLACVLQFLPAGKQSYMAADAVRGLMSRVAAKDTGESSQAPHLGTASEQVGVLPS